MDRDRWVVTKFYGRDAAAMTWPEFVSALEQMGAVTKEFAPKSAEEALAEIGNQVAETFRRNREIIKSQAEEN